MNIVIIGAGPAGLTAAYQILKHTNHTPIIVERDSNVGGISQTKKYNGNRIDLGGHRFFSKSQDVLNLWQELLPLQAFPSKDDLELNIKKTLPKDGGNPEKEDLVMLLRKRRSRIYAFQHFFDYPITFSPSTFINMGLKRTVNAGLGYLHASSHQLPNTSLENFYINRFGKPLYKMFFEDYTKKVWGVHPRELSACWGTQRIKQLSFSKIILERIRHTLKKDFKTSQTSLIEEFLYPKLGPGQLWEELAQKIKKMGGKIILNSDVVNINIQHSPERRINKITIKNLCNSIYTTLDVSAVFSSMAIKDLASVMETPTDIFKIATSLPYRNFITVGLLLNKLKISNNTKTKTINNIPPDNWIYIQDKTVNLGRLQIFNNWSPYLVDDYKKHIWLGLEYFCSDNDSLWNMSKEDSITMAISELEKINIINKEDVIDATQIKTLKAYPSYTGTYNDFNKIRDYLNTITNLYCIGRNGQHRYNNMDHSMLTSFEAVRLFSKNIQDRSSLWDVNTEDDYHESK